SSSSSLLLASCLMLPAFALSIVSTKISLSAATATTADKVLSNHATILADNSANLAISLYQNMAKEKGAENILISPVVVASSLGLVALGGKGSTASQVKTILNAAKVQDEQLHSGLAELLTEVSDPKERNVTWKISNRLYGPSSVTFAEDFVKSSKKHYKCDHSKINFRDKKSAVNSINEWAAKSTGGKLPEVTKDVENTDGAMIINAMFFKPHWDEQFHPTMVDNRGFLVSRSYTVALQMMHRTGGFLCVIVHFINPYKMFAAFSAQTGKKKKSNGNALTPSSGPSYTHLYPNLLIRTVNVDRGVNVVMTS
uniref:Serpin H1 n=1 Tax=Xiphophorus couchianus TaxID=32473 RepID=A0A3B5LZA7_9TELE